MCRSPTWLVGCSLRLSFSGPLFPPPVHPRMGVDVGGSVRDDEGGAP